MDKKSTGITLKKNYEFKRKSLLRLYFYLRNVRTNKITTNKNLVKSRIKAYDPINIINKVIPGAHRDTICGLAKLSQGWVVTASKDGQLKIWDTNKGICMFNLTEPDCTEILCLARFEKMFVVTGSLDGKMRFWSLVDQKQTKAINTRSGPVTCLLGCEKGKILTGGHTDNIIKQWVINKGSNLKAYKGHEKQVNCLLSIDKDTFVSGAQDGTVIAWSIDKATVLSKFSQKNIGSIISFKKIGNKNYLAGSNSGKIFAFSTPCKVINSVDTPKSRISTFSKISKNIIATGDSHGEIKFYDKTSFKMIKSIKAGDNSIYALLHLRKNELITCFEKIPTLNYINIQTGATKKVIEGNYPGVTCLLNIDDLYLAIGRNDGKVAILNLVTRTFVRTYTSHTSEIVQMFQVKKSAIASLSNDGVLNIWNPYNLKTQQTLTSEKPENKTRAYMHMLDNENLLMLYVNQKASILNLSTQQTKVFDNTCSTFNSVVKVNRNSIACSITGVSDFYLYDLNDFKQTNVFKAHFKTVNCLNKIASDTLASGSEDKDLRIWNVETQHCIWTFSCEASIISMVRSSAKYLILACDQTNVIAWGIRMGSVAGSKNAKVSKYQPITCICTRTVVIADQGNIIIWSI